jgi:hypothetical protein
MPAIERCERIQQAIFLKIEHMIVGKAHGPHIARAKHVNGIRIGAEMKDLGRARPHLPACGDGAFEIGDHRVRRAHYRPDVAPERVRRTVVEFARDQTSEHDVPDQGKEHRPAFARGRVLGTHARNHSREVEAMKKR